ncbi:MAG: YqaA family protein [Pseudomonadota bacterium]
MLFALFFSAFTSATILPGTSEAALAALVATGEHAVWLLVAVATTGNVLGSLVNWGLGLWIEHFRHKRWFPVSAAQYERAERWFNRYGLWALLFAWLPVIGDPLTLVAGALRVKFWPFVVLVTLGKAARYAMISGATIWISGVIT